MADALKPCECGALSPETPHLSCGGSHQHPLLWRYHCLKCPASTAWHLTSDDARIAWNRRALPSVEDVAKLRDVIGELLALREAEGGAECEITTNARAVLALIEGNSQ